MIQTCTSNVALLSASIETNCFQIWVRMHRFHSRRLNKWYILQKPRPFCPNLCVLTLNDVLKLLSSHYGNRGAGAFKTRARQVLQSILCIWCESQSTVLYANIYLQRTTFAIALRDSKIRTSWTRESHLFLDVPYPDSAFFSPFSSVWYLLSLMIPTHKLCQCLQVYFIP